MAGARVPTRQRREGEQEAEEEDQPPTESRRPRLPSRPTARHAPGSPLGEEWDPAAAGHPARGGRPPENLAVCQPQKIVPLQARPEEPPLDPEAVHRAYRFHRASARLVNDGTRSDGGRSPVLARLHPRPRRGSVPRRTDDGEIERVFGL